MTWRHVERGWDKACACWGTLEGFSLCGCTTPTPDPERGCAKCWFSEKVHPSSQYTKGRHTYTPSRCTCGHPIEEGSR